MESISNKRAQDLQKEYLKDKGLEVKKKKKTKSYLRVYPPKINPREIWYCEVWVDGKYKADFPYCQEEKAFMKASLLAVYPKAKIIKLIKKFQVGMRNKGID